MIVQGSNNPLVLTLTRGKSVADSERGDVIA